MPGDFARLDALRGTPAGGGGPTGLQTVGGLQYEIDRQLAAEAAWRWWDRAARPALYPREPPQRRPRPGPLDAGTSAASGAEWTPPFPGLLNELRAATNRLTVLRRLPLGAIASRPTAFTAPPPASATGPPPGPPASPSSTARTTASARAWWKTSASRRPSSTRVVAEMVPRRPPGHVDLQHPDLLAAGTVTAAWLELETEGCSDSADYSDTFTAEVVNSSGLSRGTFDSDDYVLHTITLHPSDLNTAGETVLGSAQPGQQRRPPAWAPPGRTTRAPIAKVSAWGPPPADRGGAI